jgi:hypothetical protein
MVLTTADLSGIPFRDRTLGLLPFFLALPDAAPPIIRPVLHLVLASDQLPLFEGDPLGSCAWFTNAEGEDEGEGWIPRPCRLTGDLFRFEPVFNKLPDELMYLSPLFDDTNLFLVEPGDIATASDRDIPSAEPVESSARDAFRYAVTLHGIIEVPGFREPGGHDGRTVPVPIAASP